jgi:hypothetical protein
MKSDKNLLGDVRLLRIKLKKLLQKDNVPDGGDSPAKQEQSNGQDIES